MSDFIICPMLCYSNETDEESECRFDKRRSKILSKAYTPLICELSGCTIAKLNQRESTFDSCCSVVYDDDFYVKNRAQSWMSA